MTDLRKLLETLEDYVEQALAQHDQQYQRHPSTERDRQVIVDDLEALRQALAMEKFSEVNQELEQALAQPEQEPYDQTALELCEKCGWKAIIPDEGCLVCARGKEEPAAWIVESKHGNWAPYLEWSEPSYLETQIVTPLYTAPPKREWVGLTDEQFSEACRLAEQGNYLTAFRRIQAYLKEKNT